MSAGLFSSLVLYSTVSVTVTVSKMLRKCLIHDYLLLNVNFLWLLLYTVPLAQRCSCSKAHIHGSPCAISTNVNCCCCFSPLLPSPPPPATSFCLTGLCFWTSLEVLEDLSKKNLCGLLIQDYMPNTFPVADQQCQST